MKSIRLIAQSLFAVLLLALASGCTHLMKVVIQPVALPAGQMLPHHVALVLDQEFANYKYEFHRQDTYIYPLGAPLQDYARQVAGKTFQQVDVVPSLETAASLTSADLILIPRAVKCECAAPVWGWENANLTFVVSWTAKDRATQNTIWLQTITANATGKLPEIFEFKKVILYQKLFDDLSLKTYKAFQDAPELRGKQP
jgi:hypothetical protein